MGGVGGGGRVKGEKFAKAIKCKKERSDEKAKKRGKIKKKIDKFTSKNKSNKK